METRFFTPGEVPEHTTTAWYEQRDRAPHLEQAAHRARLLLAAEFVQYAAPGSDPFTVSDLGCGDGGLLSLIQPLDGCTCWGYDLQPTNIAAARDERGVDARLGDVLTDPVRWGDISVCTETLEHLIDPHAFLARRVKSRAIVASSPAFETEQVHYEFHTWAWDMDGYSRLFTDHGWVVRRHQLSGMFQVIWAVRP